VDDHSNRPELGASQVAIPSPAAAMNQPADDQVYRRSMLPAPAGQVSPSLHDLAEAVRAAHAGVVAGFSSAAACAVEAGRKLKAAKAAAGHGRFGEFLEACDINARTARRYMQLAELAANWSSTTVLSGVSIEGAIKLLAPPKSAKSSKPTALKPPIKSTKTVASAKPNPKAAHVDIIELLLAASLTDRTRAIDAIGLEALLAAIPSAWLPLLADRLAERQVTAPATTVDSALIPSDLGIPQFLDRRSSVTPVIEEESPVVTTTVDPIDVPTSPAVAVTPKPKSKPVPKVSKYYQAADRDPWPSNWRKLDADALEEAIRDVQIFGVNHLLEDCHHAQLKKMRARLDELRAAEAAINKQSGLLS
jgi:hypothetical protein